LEIKNKVTKAVFAVLLFVGQKHGERVVMGLKRGAGEEC
jgi:hypothetical protein